MRAIAETGRGATAADQTAIEGAARYMFGYDGLVDAKATPRSRQTRWRRRSRDPSSPRTRRSSGHHGGMDAPVDDGKLMAVLDYAVRLGIHARYINEITEATQQQLQKRLPI